MRAKNPGNIIREQFEPTHPSPESARKPRTLRTVASYQVIRAVPAAKRLLAIGSESCPTHSPSNARHAYVQTGSAQDEESVSLPERALTKPAWRGPGKTGARRLERFPIEAPGREALRHSESAGQGGGQKRFRKQTTHCNGHIRPGAGHCSDEGKSGRAQGIHGRTGARQGSPQPGENPLCDVGDAGKRP